MSLERIRDRLRTTIGLDPDTLSRNALAGEVQRRMRAEGTPTVTAYAERLDGDGGEFDRLVTALLVHETSFFRYPASFALLADEARRRAAAERAAPFRVYSVACATGEEPASVAMTLLDAGLPPDRFEVDALDLSAQALAQARAGHYRRRTVRPLTQPLRDRHFEAVGEHWRLRPAVLGRIQYRRGNVMDPAFGLGAKPYDAVFCRNLLIYLTPAARADLLERLRAMLRPGGLLFVGHAEVAAIRALGLPLARPAEAFACRHVAASPSPPQPAGEDAPVAWPEERTTATVSAAAARASRVAAAPASPPRPGLAEAARLADAGDLVEARRVLTAALEAGAVTADHYHLLAVIDGALSRDDASEQALIRALYLDSEHYASLVQLALLAEQRGERARAARLRAKARRVRGAEVSHGDA